MTDIKLRDLKDSIARGFISLAEAQDLVAEVERLQSWKREASEVLNGIRLQEVGAELGVPWGGDIGPSILPGIRKLKGHDSVSNSGGALPALSDEVAP